MEYPTVPWDRGMRWTLGHTCICRGTGGHPIECPTVPWDCRMGWTQFMAFLDYGQIKHGRVKAFDMPHLICENIKCLCDVEILKIMYNK